MQTYFIFLSRSSLRVRDCFSDQVLAYLHTNCVTRSTLNNQIMAKFWKSKDNILKVRLWAYQASLILFVEHFRSPCQCVTFRVIEMNFLKKAPATFWTKLTKTLTKWFTQDCFFNFWHLSFSSPSPHFTHSHQPPAPSTAATSLPNDNKCRHNVTHTFGWMANACPSSSNP